MNKWIGFEQGSDDAKLHIIAFSYAGGTANIYKNLFNSTLYNEIKITGIDIPGHGKRIREKRYTEIKSLVKKMVVDLDYLYKKNIVLMGYSLGGILAYELANYWQKNNRVIKALIIIARIPPHLADYEEKRGSYNRIQMRDSVIQLGGVPSEVIQANELFEYYLDILEDDFKLVDSYKRRSISYGEYPIITYGGISDKEAKFIDLREWNKYTSNFKIRIFEGNHFFLEKNKNIVAKQILKDLHDL